MPPETPEITQTWTVADKTFPTREAAEAFLVATARAKEAAALLAPVLPSGQFMPNSSINPRLLVDAMQQHPDEFRQAMEVLHPTA